VTQTNLQGHTVGVKCWLWQCAALDSSLQGREGMVIAAASGNSTYQKQLLTVQPVLVHGIRRQLQPCPRSCRAGGLLARQLHYKLRPLNLIHTARKSSSISPVMKGSSLHCCATAAVADCRAAAGALVPFSYRNEALCVISPCAIGY